MSESRVEVKDNSEEVLTEFEKAIERALVKCGAKAEREAKKLAPVDTGLLRNSITYALSGKSTAIQTYEAKRAKVKGGEPKTGSYEGTAPGEVGEKAVYVGTNVEYAACVELGTGIYAEGGGGSPPWRYKDDAGNWHYTKGHEAKPFLRPAAANYKDVYRNIIEKELKGL